MELPNQLRVALERELRGRGGEAIARAAAELSARYRDDGGGPVDAVAYAATRMPATYAACAAALAAVAQTLPGFAPASLLDVGAGTGAALWAADATWPSLASADLVEGSPAMIELGFRLARRGGPPVAGARWVCTDLIAPWENVPNILTSPQYDLVTAAYLFGELPAGARADLVARLWARAGQAMVLVEPGTPRGWATIRAAREQLRAAGAHLVAPCPHEGTCPMPADPEADWCHFAQRLARSKAQRAAKGATLGFEDEKFAYVAAARRPGELPAARVLRHPLTRQGRVELALCTREGLERIICTRSDRTVWATARDLAWGDPIPQLLLDQAQKG